jgi:hypothetical protein
MEGEWVCVEIREGLGIPTCDTGPSRNTVPNEVPVSRLSLIGWPMNTSVPEMNPSAITKTSPESSAIGFQDKPPRLNSA